MSIVELGVSIDHTFYLTAPWREKRSEMEGVEVFSYYMRAVPKAVRYNIGHWINLCEKAVDRYISSFGKPDVLHAHCCKNAGLAAKEISQRLGIPFFITEHIPSGLYERDFGHRWQKHRWVQERMRQTYESANCVIPVSKELTDDLAYYFGKNYRYHPISNIVDTDFFTYRERDGWSMIDGKWTFDRPYRFCCLAVADIFRKGYDVLAEAWPPSCSPKGEEPEASPRGGLEGAELHIVGQGTDSKPMQQLFAHRPNVHLYGHLDKKGVRDMLWHCDALVLPSRSEAQPLVILEALATGIPVVSTECIPSSLRIPEACRFAPIGNARKLGEMMLEVMRIAPSQEFSAIVQRMASPSVVAQQLTDLFTLWSRSAK